MNPPAPQSSLQCAHRWLLILTVCAEHWGCLAFCNSSKAGSQGIALVPLFLSLHCSLWEQVLSVVPTENKVLESKGVLESKCKRPGKVTTLYAHCKISFCCWRQVKELEGFSVLCEQYSLPSFCWDME